MLLSCLSVNAQNKIGFSYDPAGNRILRELVLSSSRSREANPSVSSDMVGDREIKICPNLSLTLNILKMAILYASLTLVIMFMDQNPMRL